jgi:hypothetical protein
MNDQLRKSSSWLWRRVALVRMDVSEERIAFIIRARKIGELGELLALTTS